MTTELRLPVVCRTAIDPADVMVISGYAVQAHDTERLLDLYKLNGRVYAAMEPKNIGPLDPSDFTIYRVTYGDRDVSHGDYTVAELFVEFTEVGWQNGMRRDTDWANDEARNDHIRDDLQAEMAKPGFDLNTWADK